MKKKKEIFEIFESVTFPLLMLNKNLRIIKYNREAERELNLMELFRKNKEVYFSPISFNMFDKEGKKFEKDFSLKSGIIKIIIKDKEKYFEVNYKEIKNEKGKLKNYMVTLTNITDIVENSRRLQHSQLLLEMLQRITKKMYMESSLEKICELIEEEVEKTLKGIKVKIYIKRGKIFHEIKGDIFDESMLSFINIIENGKNFLEENIVIKKNLSKFEKILLKNNIFSFICIPFFGKGELAGFFLCGQDKTGKMDEETIKSMEEIAHMLSLWNERKLFSEEMEEYLKNIKTISEIALQFSKITSLEETYRYAVKKLQEFSKAEWAVIFLLDEKNEKLVANFIQNVPEEIVENYRILPMKSITGESIINKNVILVEKYEEHIKAIKDGVLDKYVKSMIAIPLTDERGNVIGALDLIYLRNKKFTEREREFYKAIGHQLGIAIQNAKLWEELKKYTNKLEDIVKQRTMEIEKLNKELEEYIYSVSHDLRTPLMAIEGYSHLLLTRFSDLNNEAKEYIKHINNTAKRTSKLIEDLLNYARLGKKEIKIEKVNINEVLRYVIANLSEIIKKENAKIEYPESIPPINSNFELMVQIFQNLISNSIKFHKKEEPPLIKIYYAIEPGRIKIFCEDNGIGIEKENLTKIFNLFTQLDKSYEGTGIGLSIVKKAVEILKGEISVDSTPGKGTIFCLKFNYP